MQSTVFSQVLKHLLLLALPWLLSGCSVVEKQKSAARLERAMALYQQHCRDAGEKIYKTVENVEGIFLIKVRPEELNWGDQYRLDDPYGRDFGGNGYIESFLRGSFQANSSDIPAGAPPRYGFKYVDAVDSTDGKRYRYIGRLEEPWQTNKAYLKGYVRFVLNKTPVAGAASRYGVTYEDISTPEDRSYWIAGSSLKVIDLQTGEVLAERIGYMIDMGQGGSAGGRSPWLFAANNACPEFGREFKNRKSGSQHAAGSQTYQTLDFVEKILKPQP